VHAGSGTPGSSRGSRVTTTIPEQSKNPWRSVKGARGADLQALRPLGFVLCEPYGGASHDGGDLAGRGWERRGAWTDGAAGQMINTVCWHVVWLAQFDEEFVGLVDGAACKFSRRRIV
jgi:hypothetical protein